MDFSKSKKKKKKKKDLDELVGEDEKDKTDEKENGIYQIYLKKINVSFYIHSWLLTYFFLYSDV